MPPFYESCIYVIRCVLNNDWELFFGILVPLLTVYDQNIFDADIFQCSGHFLIKETFKMQLR